MAKHFANFDSDRIVAAIAAAEKGTSGEIRVHLTRHAPKDLEARALRRFHLLGMTKTAERNGVLIYIAPRARVFRILGDTAIHEKCGEGFWKEVVVAGVELVGVVLARHFPRLAKDQNELPDEVTED